MGERNDIIGETLFALTPFAVRQRGRDLSLTAVSTLSTLERTGPRRLTDLAVNEGVTQPSMTAVVTQLENLGFAERRRAPGDGRVVMVTITRAGTQYLHSVRCAGASAITALVDKLGEQEVAALSAALPALRHLLDLAGEDETRTKRSGEGGSTPGPQPDSPAQKGLEPEAPSMGR
ncbi:MAG TPA: MarR family transcriptional regulator [Actinomycetota bacterium]|jgi:DNA-binding MarR family transcriptional regulator|nr:MarR family transcriptional regulator [Actinomycetota bacterium]